MTPLPGIDVRARERRAKQQLGAHEIDAMIITAPSNIRWLTGFAGSNGTVVLTAQQLTLITDSRYADRAPQELDAVASSAAVVIERLRVGSVVRELVGSAVVIGLEADHVSWNQMRKIDSDWLPDHELVATVGALDRLRSRKDAAELARISAAANIVDSALGDVRPLLATGLSERAFAQSLDAAIRAGGAEDLGFDTIVASGPNGAIPHHSPGERSIQKGDLVIVDVGAKVDGYRSDMTRSFCVGPMSKEQRRHYDVVAAAQQAGVEAMVAGAETSSVDAAARAVIADAGWADRFTHGAGHGVGLDIHELPRVAAGATDIYEVGTVATVEPGVYLRDISGVRVEDTCVVTASGAERLTLFPKDPEVL